MLSLGHILAALTDYEIHGDEAQVAAVQIDSRAVRTGDLFVAFDGEQVDGHDYVKQAFERGARVALVEKVIEGVAVIDASRPFATSGVSLADHEPFSILVENTELGLQTIARFWRDHFADIQIVGITGSVGKTSTKELTHAVLSQRFVTLKTPKNYNNEIGLPLTILQLAAKHTHAVLEMGMYDKGEIALLCTIARPQIGMVTNIGPVHMSRLGSVEAITEAKRELVEALPEDGIAILNRDDERVMGMAEHTRAKVFTYGLADTADLWASDIKSMGMEGIRFAFHYKGERWPVAVPLLGRHSVHTCLRAAAVALNMGMRWEEIINGLRGQPSQLRLVTVRGPHNSLILDDTYNASPSSVIAALNLLSDLDGRRIAVLGDMLELGSAEEISHRRVGRRAMAVADILVTVGERGRIIADEALAAGMPSNVVYVCETTAQAADVLQDQITGDDIILVKGSLGARMDKVVWALSRMKGHE